ncbi:MAG: class I SAM-dependent methyltransferase [Chloroflexi bacterium]|nr:class I SAM-dependent methyltransferase [Chloroflexota bacterium]
MALVRIALNRIKMECLLLPFALVCIKNIKFKDIDSLVDFSFNVAGGLIRPLQVKSEIIQLLEIINQRKPELVVEIGTYRGGVMFLLSRVASPTAELISIDYPDVRFGGGYESWMTCLIKGFKSGRQKIHLIWGDSHRADTLTRVSDILNGRKADLMFIDGDHSYEGVKKDFKMYSPLVKQGGMLVFHDVVIHTAELGCEVNKLWIELKDSEQYRTDEIINDVTQNTCGIGIIYT